MNTIPFSEANHLIVPGALSANLKKMPVYTDGHSCISVWQLTDEDIKLLSDGKLLYVIVGTSPEKHPAIGISAENFIPDFNKKIIIPDERG